MYLSLNKCNIKYIRVFIFSDIDVYNMYFTIAHKHFYNRINNKQFILFYIS